MYVRKKDLAVFSFADLQREHIKSTSFRAEGPEDEWLEENGYAKIIDNVPSHDGETHVLEVLGVIEASGLYYFKYDLRKKTDDELSTENRRLIFSRISDLEQTITERRKREAILTEEGKAWLEQVNAEIIELRKGL